MLLASHSVWWHSVTPRCRTVGVYVKMSDNSERRSNQGRLAAKGNQRCVRDT